MRRRQPVAGDRLADRAPGSLTRQIMTNDSPDTRDDARAGSPGDASHRTGRDDSGATPRRRGLEGQVIADRYRVVRLVSAGANTLIADADDLELHRLVTVKLLRPEFAASAEFRQRFEQQMEAVAALSHPNLASVHDLGAATVGKRNTVFVVSEYLSGGSLRDLFDRRRMLSPSQALAVGLDACRALDFAHRKGFVHTELTPSKLVFGDDRRLRIVDFGLARVLNEEVWTDPSDLPTHVARYASPEQAQGLPVDGHTDVYSLALILHEAVTGEVPFSGDSTVATLANRVDRLMPVSADLGPLASVLERAGRPEPSERWSAAQFGKALMRAAERLPRPEPIPILAPSPLNVDPALLRRPNDPTGGIHRPDDPPQPALVLPGEEPVSAGRDNASVAASDAATIEVAAPESAVDVDTGDVDTAGLDAADVRTADGSTAAGSTAAGAATEGADPDVPAAGDAVAPGDDDAVAAPDSAGAADPDEPVTGGGLADLAELVERTPPKPPGAENEIDPSSRIDVVAPIVATSPGTPTRANAPVATRGGAGGATTERVPVEELVGKTLSKKERKAAARRAKSRAKQQPSTPAGPPPSEQSESVSQAAASKPAVTPRPAPQPARSAPQPARPAPSARPRRRLAPIAFTLAMLAALGGIGAIAWQLFRTENRAVPALAGLTIEQGLAEINDFGWDVNTRTARSDDFPTPGQIIRTVPAPESELGKGSPLTIFYSVGPELRTLPSLAGQPVDEATATLTELGLVAAPAPVHSETVAPGTVVSVAADGQGPGAEVLPGATVTLEVSQGPAPRTLPNLAGATPEQAAAMLDRLGLSVAIGEPVFDNAVPSGMVAAQAPAAGEGALPGTEVVIHLSQGVDMVPMPDLSGMNLVQITQALGDAGLFVGTVVGDPGGAFVAAGSGASPIAPGDSVRRGSLVNVVIL